MKPISPVAGIRPVAPPSVPTVPRVSAPPAYKGFHEGPVTASSFQGGSGQAVLTPAAPIDQSPSGGYRPLGQGGWAQFHQSKPKGLFG